jgi:hypothetical protein
LTPPGRDQVVAVVGSVDATAGAVVAVVDGGSDVVAVVAAVVVVVVVVGGSDVVVVVVVDGGSDVVVVVVVGGSEVVVVVGGSDVLVAVVVLVDVVGALVVVIGALVVVIGALVDVVAAVVLDGPLLLGPAFSPRLGLAGVIAAAAGPLLLGPAFSPRLVVLPRDDPARERTTIGPWPVTCTAAPVVVASPGDVPPSSGDPRAPSRPLSAPAGAIRAASAGASPRPSPAVSCQASTITTGVASAAPTVRLRRRRPWRWRIRTLVRAPAPTCRSIDPPGDCPAVTVRHRFPEHNARQVGATSPRAREGWAGASARYVRSVTTFDGTAMHPAVRPTLPSPARSPEAYPFGAEALSVG